MDGLEHFARRAKTLDVSAPAARPGRISWDVPLSAQRLRFPQCLGRLAEQCRPLPVRVDSGGRREHVRLLAGRGRGARGHATRGQRGAGSGGPCSHPSSKLAPGILCYFASRAFPLTTLCCALSSTGCSNKPQPPRRSCVVQARLVLPREKYVRCMSSNTPK